MQSGGRQSSSKRQNGNTDLPMKIRRRQSDAKWRANVASCYETLKHIIPVNKRATKRQISKAVILEETSKHINFLENILTTLLQEKGEKDGLCGDNQDKWVDDEITTIKDDFIDKQGEKMNIMNDERRYKRNRYKRYISDNMMQESIQNTASVRSVILEQRNADYTPKKCPISSAATTIKRKLKGTTADGCESPQKKPGKLHNAVTPLKNIQNINQEVPSTESGATTVKTALTKEEKQFIMPISYNIMPEGAFVIGDVSIIHANKEQQAEDQLIEDLDLELQEVPEMFFSDVEEDEGLSIGQCVPVKEVFQETPAPPSTPVKTTPNKLMRAPEHHGFTPVKLPHEWTVGPFTPLSASKTNIFLDGSGCDTDDDTQSLLCKEDMWLSDDEDGDQTLSRFENTPNVSYSHTELRPHNVKRRKRKRCESSSSQQSDSKHQRFADKEMPKCRRSLDINMTTQRSFNECKEDEGQRDFDGYFLFYQKMVQKLQQLEPAAGPDKVSKVIYNMWQELPREKKGCIKDMAEAEPEPSQESGTEVSDTLDFDASFCPLADGPWELQNETKFQTTWPVGDSLMSDETNMIEISEVDVKPIMGLTEPQNADDCPWTFTDVSPLFGTSMSDILSHIKTEKIEQ